MAPWLLGLIPNLFNAGKEYLTRKQKLREIETESQVAIKTAVVNSKIRRAESDDVVAADLDKASIGQIPWGDDWLLILVSFPVVVTMLSPFVDLYFLTQAKDFVYEQGLLAKAVGTGFEELSKAPEWYWYLFGAVTVYTLGMRKLLRLFLEKLTLKLPLLK